MRTITFFSNQLDLKKKVRVEKVYKYISVKIKNTMWLCEIY